MKNILKYKTFYISGPLDALSHFFVSFLAHPLLSNHLDLKFLNFYTDSADSLNFAQALCSNFQRLTHFVNLATLHFISKAR